MNRRTVVAGTALLAAAAFAGGAWYVGRTPEVAAADPAAPAPAGLDMALLNRPYSPILGPPDAPVTITEFFDPSCEACRAFHPILKQVRAAFPTEVRIVMRYAAFHQGSDEAVRILETARVQGVFEPVLNALLERQPEWAVDGAPNLDMAWIIAGEVGLDVEKAKVDRMLPGIVSTLAGDAADIETLGINRTPTLFVNGKPLTEFSPEAFFAMVRAEVEAL